MAVRCRRQAGAGILGKTDAGTARLYVGDGDWPLPIPLVQGDGGWRFDTAAGKDEIGRLGNVFNDMIVRLHELYRELQREESYLAEAQQLSHTGSFGWDVSSGKIHWSLETFRIFEYAPGCEPTIEAVIERTHPEDRSNVQQLVERVSRNAQVE